MWEIEIYLLVVHILSNERIHSLELMYGFNSGCDIFVFHLECNALRRWLPPKTQTDHDVNIAFNDLFRIG